ncbi:MAG: hypothetical protein EA424_16425 [Planctomycetaceae bacterium]|nr:MAG: hypothetical protein EA424_16425 [Planctomycetaceae bacterium]
MAWDSWMAKYMMLAALVVVVTPVVLRSVDASEPIFNAVFHVDGTFDPSEGDEDFGMKPAKQSIEAWCNRCPSDSWRVTADALLLTRRDPASAALFVDQADNAEVLNASDFHLGVHAGFDASLTRWMCDRFGIECRYFGVDHWNASVNVPTMPGTRLNSVNASPPVTVSAGTAIAASLSSELHNFELNARYRWNDQWTLLAGFRYAELDERFAADLIEPPVPFSIQTVTRNRLYGGQLGADVLLWDCGGRFTADAFGKAGIFGNAAANRSSYTTGISTQTAIGDRTPVSFLGELGIRGNYHFSQRWSAQA